MEKFEISPQHSFLGWNVKRSLWDLAGHTVTFESFHGDKKKDLRHSRKAEAPPRESELGSEGSMNNFSLLHGNRGGTIIVVTSSLWRFLMLSKRLEFLF